jgi:phosphatidylglycerol:prolipoprotein diacylglycerol transferase
MMTFPNIDPILLSLGPLHIRWYGLMYVLGFMASYFLVRRQIRLFSYQALEPSFENLNLVLILSVVLGGRLGYVLFYNFSYYLHHPLEIPATWTGGMSFHGACIGVLVGGWLFLRKEKLDYWKVADIYVVTVPIGLGLGRLGNFINGELYGRVTDVPWGMIFPGGGPLPRHPSQIYEMLLEGVALFCVLWSQKARPWQISPGSLCRLRWPHGSMVALFLICYGLFRFLVELVREPDPQIGLLRGLFTMGQLLSSLMIVSGLGVWIVLGYRQGMGRGKY